MPPPLTAPAQPTQGEALHYWLKLGFISFGGAAGQIGMMHDERVERRRWISEKRFLHALNDTMVLPGPEAQQLATYLGWLLHGTRGGLIAGPLFILPSLAIMIGLAWVYLAFGNVKTIDAVFYGIKPAVIAIIVYAGWRIGRKVLGNAALLDDRHCRFRRHHGFQGAVPDHRRDGWVDRLARGAVGAGVVRRRWRTRLAPGRQRIAHGTLRDR